MQHYLEAFAQWQTRLGYSPATIQSNTQRLHVFFDWLKEQQVNSLSHISKETIARYQEHVHQRRNKRGGGLSSGTIDNHVTNLELFNAYLQKHDHQVLPLEELQHPQRESVTRTILTQQEIKKLYEATDDSPFGYRDRAMLGIYYGCGLRLSEGLALLLEDIDIKHHYVHVKKGKGNKQRYVPMNKRIRNDLTDYIHYSRSWFLDNAYPHLKQITNHLFVTKQSSPCKPMILNVRLRRLAEEAGINKTISLHCLRHSIATHLLQNGLSLEQIAQFLGHSSLESTQLYTHLSADLSVRNEVKAEDLSKA
jgi:integrase/recombinase XerD